MQVPLYHFFSFNSVSGSAVPIIQFEVAIKITHEVYLVSFEMFFSDILGLIQQLYNPIYAFHWGWARRGKGDS